MTEKFETKITTESLSDAINAIDNAVTEVLFAHPNIFTSHELAMIMIGRALNFVEGTNNSENANVFYQALNSVVVERMSKHTIQNSRENFNNVEEIIKKMKEGPSDSALH